jgi:DNA repair exonuclease SbcCD ATPase subunit
MRNTLNLCRGMLLSVALLMFPGAVMAAGFSDKLAEKVTKDPQAQEQIKNAADALEAEVESAATKGKATAGASGPMMQLLYSSDTLICSAWIISFRLEVDRLTGIAAQRDMTAEEHKIQQAARELLSRVERACDGVLQPGMATSVTSPATAGATPPPSTEAPPAGQPFTPRPGWTITDEICARTCSAESAADQRADWNKYRAEENEKKARERLSSAERELAAERENLSRAEARLEAARANLDRLEKFNRRAGGVTRGSPSDMNLSNARRNVRDGQQEVGGARRRVESKEQAASEARGSAERATAARERAEQEAANAQTALDNCLRDCYRRAASATGTSSGTSTGTSAGTSAGASTGTTTDTSGGTTTDGFTGYQPGLGTSGGD